MSPNDEAPVEVTTEAVTEVVAEAPVVQAEDKAPKSKKINLSRPGVLAEGDLPPSVKDKQPLDQRIRRREVLEDGTIIETY